MKVIWTLKNSPNPHIHDKATEFPHRIAFNQRKFIKSAKESRFPPSGKLDSQRVANRVQDKKVKERRNAIAVRMK
jgi:hypothetical protein